MNNSIKDESLNLKQENLFVKKNQYQYQQQTAEPEKVYRETLLGQALITSLRNLKTQGFIGEKSDLPE